MVRRQEVLQDAPGRLRGEAGSGFRRAGAVFPRRLLPGVDGGRVDAGVVDEGPAERPADELPEDPLRGLVAPEPREDAREARLGRDVAIEEQQSR